jgi:MFS transporter, DHA1 family, tetracycline resistance protein
MPAENGGNGRASRAREGESRRRAAGLGLGFGVGGFLVAALAHTGVEFWIGIPLLALWGLESPASMALMSRHVGATEQGRLQGANASVTGIANLFGPGLFTQVFAVAIGGGRESPWTGAPFMLASLLIAAAGVLAWHVTRGRLAPKMLTKPGA